MSSVGGRRGDEGYDDERVPGGDDPCPRHRRRRLGGPRRLRTSPHLPPRSREGSARGIRTRRAAPVRHEQHPVRHRHADRLLGVQQGRALRPAHADRRTADLRLRLGGQGAPPAAPPPVRRDELGRREHGAPGRDPSARRPAGARRAGDQVDHGRGRRRRHAARRGCRRDVDLPRARERGDRGPRRATGDGRCSRDQESRRAHAADAGLRDGRRRLPGHLRGAQARRPRERHRRARARAALRDGLGVRRGHQLDRRRAVQPAPARLLRSARSGRATRRTSTSSTSSTATGRATTARSSSAGRRRRSGTRSLGRASGWTPRSTS